MTDAMKFRIRNKLYGAYIFSSPWLSAAAAALLALIIATFALQNYRLERRLMREALEQRAATLARVLQFNIRLALTDEVRRHWGLSVDWPARLQQVVEHLDDPHLRFARVTDRQGNTLAQTGQARVGFPSAPAGRTAEQASFPYDSRGGIRYELLKEAGGAGLLAASVAFVAFAHDYGSGAIPGNFPGKFVTPLSRPPHWARRRLLPYPPAPEGALKQEFFVSIGLDTRDLDLALTRLRGQILLLSVTLLLVGVGGWLSLVAAQGYRVSQQTVEKVRSYTTLLVAQLPLGVIATTPGGRIETWNAAMRTLTGRSAGEARGRLPAEVLPPELAAFFADDRGVAPESPPLRLGLDLAGKRRVLFCRLLALTDALQSYRGRVLLLSDVTEQDDLERQIRENERLAAIGRVAGAVAHEVRNPLSSIKGLAFLLQSKFAEGSREREFAGLLVRETERLNRSITEMLELTRPASLVPAAVDMAALLEQSLALMAAELGEAGIVARLDCPADPPPVWGDGDRLRQVLMNVLLNARQAMEGGGRLSVAACPSPCGRFLEITVADTGPGIPPDKLAHVFEPYFTTKAGGSGIGLAVTRKIVTDHRGTIDIRSEAGQGTTVRIRLPAKRPEEAAG